MITITLYTADGCEGTFEITVQADGTISHSPTGWAPHEAEMHTIDAIISSDELEDLVITGNQWRGLEGELDTDAFYRALVAGDVDTVQQMLDEAETV